MEELNNHQMILLTMFISFVVSIATGIITVAMLQVAPETLTQTVNRVVEHTIERVVSGTTTPEKTTPGSTITNITKETVYAKEDDLVIAAVEKNQPRVVQIYGGASASTTTPLTIGFVVSRDGLIATEPRSLLGEGVAKESYTIIIGDKSYAASPVPGQESINMPVYFLKITKLASTDTLDSVTYGRTENPKLAQTVVVLGGTEGAGVFKTTLSRLRFSKTNSTTTPVQYLVGIETLPRIPDQNTGGLVVNLDGQVVGIVIPDTLDSARSVVYPISRILELVGAKSQAKGSIGESNGV